MDALGCVFDTEGVVTTVKEGEVRLGPDNPFENVTLAPTATFSMVVEVKVNGPCAP